MIKKSIISILVIHSLRASVPAAQEIADIDYSVAEANTQVELAIAQVLPGAFTESDKQCLSEFITYNQEFERGNSLFFRLSPRFLDITSINLTHQKLLDSKTYFESHMESAVQHARVTHKRCQELATQCMCQHKANSTVKIASSNKTRTLLIGNPWAITLAYLSSALTVPKLLDRALFYATTRTSGSLCRTLLLTGANPEWRNEKGWTPLIRACAARHSFMHCPIDDDSFLEYESAYYENSPLGNPLDHYFNFVPLLTQFGADINKPAYDGTTPLHAACAQANRPMVQQLLHGQMRPDVSALNSKGFSPLMLAARNSHVSRTRRLILIYLRDYAARNDKILSDAEEFACNMPYAMGATAHENEKTLHKLAQANALRNCAQKQQQSNIFCALRMREVGLAKPLKLATKKKASVLTTDKLKQK